MKKTIAIVALLASTTIFAANTTTPENSGDKAPSTITKTITYPDGTVEKVVTKTSTDGNNSYEDTNISVKAPTPKISEKQKKEEKLYSDFSKDRREVILSMRENGIKLQKELSKDNPDMKKINKLIDTNCALGAKLEKEKIALELKMRKLESN